MFLLTLLTQFICKFINFRKCISEDTNDGITECPNGKIGYINFAKFGKLYGSMPYQETGPECQRNMSNSVSKWCKGKAECSFDFKIESFLLLEKDNIKTTSIHDI